MPVMLDYTTTLNITKRLTTNLIINIECTLRPVFTLLKIYKEKGDKK